MKCAIGVLHAPNRRHGSRAGHRPEHDRARLPARGLPGVAATVLASRRTSSPASVPPLRYCGRGRELGRRDIGRGPDGRQGRPGSLKAIAKATTEPRFLRPGKLGAGPPDVPSPRITSGTSSGLRANSPARPASRAVTVPCGRQPSCAGQPHRPEPGGARDPARVHRRRAEPASAIAVAPRWPTSRTHRASTARRRRHSLRPRGLLPAHGGLHSRATSSPGMLIELAYRLADLKKAHDPRHPAGA